MPKLLKDLGKKKQPLVRARGCLIERMIMQTNTIKFKQKIESLKFDDKGLIPCVVQDHHSRQVLMLAWGSKDTLVQSFVSGLATYWSRSRSEIWVKGKTSGNIQEIRYVTRKHSPYLLLPEDRIIFGWQKTQLSQCEISFDGIKCNTSRFVI